MNNDLPEEQIDSKATPIENSVNERIAQLIDHLNHNPNSFAKMVKIGVHGLHKVLNGASKPGYETLKAIIDSTKVNEAWLMSGKGSMFSKKEIPDIPEEVLMAGYKTQPPARKPFETVEEPTTEYLTGKNTRVLALTQDSKGNENIELVPIKAAASYINNLQEPTFLTTLPKLSIPTLQFNRGSYRAFEVKGPSMLPTVQQGSMVIGLYVDNWLNDLKDERIYIIVTIEAVLVKRVLNRIEKRQELYLKSDNREFEAQAMPIQDVREIWEVKGELRYRFDDIAQDLFLQVQHLQADVDELKLDMEHMRLNGGFFPLDNPINSNS